METLLNGQDTVSMFSVKQNLGEQSYFTLFHAWPAVLPFMGKCMRKEY